MIPIYDLLVPHVIKVLYLMMIMSSYGTFLMLHYLVNNQDVGTDSNMVKKFKAIEIFFNISYAIMLVTGFIPKIGANCTGEITYRKDFTLFYILKIAYHFLLIAALCTFQSCNTIYFYRQGFMRKDYLPLMSEKPSNPEPSTHGGLNDSVNERLLGKRNSGDGEAIADHTSIKCYQ